MGSLSEQLLKLGFVSPEEHEKIAKKKEELEKQKIGQDQNQLTRKSGRPISFSRLEFCETIAEFRDTARKLLCEFPEEIGEVVRLAHRFMGAPGGKKLIWLVYQVRDGLVSVSPENREQFLKRAFRKFGAKIEADMD